MSEFSDVAPPPLPELVETAAGTTTETFPVVRVVYTPTHQVRILRTATGWRLEFEPLPLRAA